MKNKKIVPIAKALLKAWILKRNTPLVVGWAITNRCNRKCSYCALWQGRGKELSTEQVFKIIDTLAQLGALEVSFTGGEPLLRDDIGKIIDYVHSKGMETKINSNGALVKSKISELKNLNILNLSLEGPEQTHDAIRGEGSYKEVIEAAETAAESGIKISFVTVLTKANLGCLDFILGKAKEFNAKVMFQPATKLILGGTTSNPMAPHEAEYRRAIKELINKKIFGDRSIGNSMSALKHLYHWPNPKRIRCASGWISCRIEPNADVLYCSRERQLSKTLNCIDDGFKKAFDNLKPIYCTDCWCAGRVELNLAFRGNLSLIYEQIKELIE